MLSSLFLHLPWALLDYFESSAEIEVNFLMILDPSCSLGLDDFHPRAFQSKVYYVVCECGSVYTYMCQILFWIFVDIFEVPSMFFLSSFYCFHCSFSCCSLIDILIEIFEYQSYFCYVFFSKCWKPRMERLL